MTKKLDKPWYQSKKVFAFLAMIGTYVASLVLDAPSGAIEHLSVGAVLGGATLIGVQGWADARGVGGDT